MTKYADLHEISEDERIAMIAASAEQKLVGVILEKDEPEKVARYIEKLTTKYSVRHVDTVPGPLSTVVLVRFAPKVQQ
jgi:hypothetical protein